MSLATTGKITVSGNDFSKAAPKAYYNCIETGYGGAYQIQNGSSITNNRFGSISNNAISIFAVAEGARIEISGNSFNFCANPVLLGNMRYTPVSAKFDFKSNTMTDSEGFVLLNDNGTDVHEIFTGYSINITNLRSGPEQNVAVGNVPYRYIVNNRGIINPPDNMPTVVIGAEAASDATQSPEPETGGEVLPSASPETNTEATESPDSSPSSVPEDTATAEPTKEPAADITAEPEVEATSEPAADATTAPTGEPAAETTTAPTDNPETASPEPTETAAATSAPETLYTVSVEADENITGITLTNILSPELVFELMKDEAVTGSVVFRGSVPNGSYSISAAAADGKEVDLLNSDLTVTVNGADAAAKIASTETGDVESISIIAPPDKTTYYAGEKFDPAGLKISVSYKAESDTDAAESIAVEYNGDTASEFAFIPALDTELPKITPYDTGRTVTVIYKNRAAYIPLSFIMNHAEVTVTTPKSNTKADTNVTVPDDAYYTAGEAALDPTVYPGSNYNFSTIYTVSAVLSAKDGFTFGNTEDKPMSAKMNGYDAEYTISDDGKVMTVTYTFARTNSSGGGFIPNSDFSTNSTPRPTTKPALNSYDHFAYIVGYPDGEIKPENNITRDEVATIFFRLLTDDTRSIYWSQVNHYLDVPKDLWSNNAISTLTNAGILGGDGTANFRPADPITRAEFATIAARFSSAVTGNSGKFKDVTGHWSEKYVEIAADEGWIQGYEDGTFKPDQLITRAEAMTIVNNVLSRKVQTSGLLSGMAVWSDNRNQSEWYYTAVQEATNTHNYHRNRNSEYETWTELGDNPDWIKLEQEWSSSGSAGDIN